MIISSTAMLSTESPHRRTPLSAGSGPPVPHRSSSRPRETRRLVAAAAGGERNASVTAGSRSRQQGSNNNNSARGRDLEHDEDCCCCIGNCLSKIKSKFLSNDDKSKQSGNLRKMNLLIGLLFFVINLVSIGLELKAAKEENATLTSLQITPLCNSNDNNSTLFMADLGIGIFVEYKCNYSNWIHNDGPNIAVGKFIYGMIMTIFSLLLLLSTRLNNHPKMQIMAIIPWILIICAHLCYFLGLIIDILHGLIFRGIDTILNQNSIGQGLILASYSIGGLVIIYGIAYKMASLWLNSIMEDMTVNDTWYPKWEELCNRYYKMMIKYKPYHVISGILAVIICAYSFYFIIQLHGRQDFEQDISKYSTQISFNPYGLSWELYKCKSNKVLAIRANSTNDNDLNKCEAILDTYWIHYFWLFVSAVMMLSIIIKWKILALPWIISMDVSFVSMASKFVQLMSFSDQHLYILYVILLAIFYYSASYFSRKLICSGKNSVQNSEDIESNSQSYELNSTMPISN